MKKNWIWIAGAVVIILIGGYLGRHSLKQMMSGTSNQPAMQSTQTVINPSPSVTEAMSQATNSAAVSDVVMTKKDSSTGSYLTDSKGMTLYVFDKDTKGVSNCSGGCLALWPAYITEATPSGSLPAHITIIKRSNGSMQYAWDQMPLYYYVKDAKPGDVIGDNLGGVWHIVKP